MSDKKVLIRVQNLCKAFGDHEVLKDISVDINEGDVVCVIGPSPAQGSPRFFAA